MQQNKYLRCCITQWQVWWLGSHTASPQYPMHTLQQVYPQPSDAQSVNVQQLPHCSRPRVGQHSSYVAASFASVALRLTMPCNHSSFLVLLACLPLGLHTYDYACNHMHTCECTCVYMSVHISMSICLCICVCICISMDVCVHLCIGVYVSECE